MNSVLLKINKYLNSDILMLFKIIMILYIMVLLCVVSFKIGSTIIHINNNTINS